MPTTVERTLTRRDLLIASTASIAITNVPHMAAAKNLAAAKNMAAAQTADTGEPSMHKVSFVVNGQPRSLELDTRTTLLDALREHLHLTGTKKGCDHGQCGACTVMVDGRRINSCLTLAVMHEGDSITTIEGLGTPRASASDAGRLRQARRLPVRLLHAGPDLLGGRHARRDQGRHAEPRQRRSRLPRPQLTDAELRERMSGNICRCGAYSNIVDAIREVAGGDGMKPFTYERAAFAGEPRRRPRARAGAQASSPAAPICST